MVDSDGELHSLEMFAPEVKQRLQASYVSAINYVLSGSGN
jgi:hypothetical protein